MTLCILAGVLLLATVLTAMLSEDAGLAFPVFFIGLFASAFALIIASVFVSKSLDVPHSEVSLATYHVADNSQISNTSGKLRFFYMEDKSLKVYDDYVRSMDILNANGKTVEIHQTRYDLGTGLLPWGMDRVDTTAVIK